MSITKNKQVIFLSILLLSSFWYCSFNEPRVVERIVIERAEVSVPQKFVVVNEDIKPATLRPTEPPIDKTAPSITSISYFIENKRKFDQKNDFFHLQELGKVLASENYCSDEYTVFMGGLNKGQAAHFFMELCPKISFIGFEISVKEFQIAKDSLSKFENVKCYNMGMGDFIAKLKYFPHGEQTGFYEPKPGERFFSSTVKYGEIDVVPLASWFPTYEEEIKKPVKLIYSLFDVEGYESCVLMGLGLQHEENRKRFSSFQFELGGTWALKDPRHPKGSMSQYEIALFLEQRGYELFMVGSDVLLKVVPRFLLDYIRHITKNEGYGPFVQGNMFAMHPEFADPIILKFVRSRQVV